MTTTAGDLDLSFDNDGKVTTLLGISSMMGDMLVQADGKIVAVGGTEAGEFALTRYNPDGSTDLTFGTNGSTISDFLGTFDRIVSMVQQPDGSFVVLGISTDNIYYGQGNQNYILARYTVDGVLDASFGSNGNIITDLGGNSEDPKSLIQLNNGQFLVAGDVPAGNYTSDFALTRYNSNGSLDTSFGTGGTITTNVFASTGYGGSTEDVAKVIQLTNGDILIAGTASKNGSNSTYGDFALARYDGNGSLVAGFGTGGIVTTEFNGTFPYSQDEAYSVVEQNDGKIVVGGSIDFNPNDSSYNTDFSLARYNSNGSLDTSFGTNGKVTVNVGAFDKVKSIIQQSDGKLVAAGTDNSDFVVMRFNSDGSLDSSFGNGGKVVTDFNGGQEFDVASVVQQGNGDLVVAGTTIDATTGEYKFAVARYLGSSGVVVGANNAPVVSNTIYAQAATEDSLFTFTVPANTFSDIDGDALAYTATLTNGNPLPTWLSFNASTQTFSGTPANGDVSNLSLRVTATDGSGANASNNFTLAIANTNDAPILVAPLLSQSTTADSLFSFTLPTNTFNDIDAGDTLSLSATLANGSPLPTWLTFNPNTQTFSGTPTNAAAGNLSLRVTATDGSGATVTNDFNIGIGTHLVGNSSQNTLTGTSYNDKIEGLGGIDTLNGGDGADTLYGGDGADILNGGDGNDILYGDLGNDNLFGGNGHDILLGGLSQDILNGGSGNDILTGGTGSNVVDRFHFSGAGLGNNTVTNVLGIDTITDFTGTKDRIGLSKATFSAITSNPGSAIGSNFISVANDTLVDVQSAAIVFSQQSHKLFYNQNGSISGLGNNGGAFADLTGIANLSASNFEIIA